LIDAFTGAEAAKLEGHKDFIYRVSSMRLVGVLSCGYGGMIQLWDIAGKPVFSRTRPRLNSADLSPDGSRIIVAAAMAKCIFWMCGQCA
jgi:WD40 repeat protein